MLSKIDYIELYRKRTKLHLYLIVFSILTKRDPHYVTDFTFDWSRRGVLLAFVRMTVILPDPCGILGIQSCGPSIVSKGVAIL